MCENEKFLHISTIIADWWMNVYFYNQTERLELWTLSQATSNIFFCHRHSAHWLMKQVIFLWKNKFLLSFAIWNIQHFSTLQLPEWLLCPWTGMLQSTTIVCCLSLKITFTHIVRLFRRRTSSLNVTTVKLTTTSGSDQSCLTWRHFKMVFFSRHICTDKKSIKCDFFF